MRPRLRLPFTTGRERITDSTLASRNVREVRYAGDPAASPAMSAMPPKAEVNSEHSRLCSELSRFDGIARQIMGSGSAAHHRSASKTRVNALMVTHRVRGTQVDSATAIPLAAACLVVARAQAASARQEVPAVAQQAHPAHRARAAVRACRTCSAVPAARRAAPVHKAVVVGLRVAAYPVATESPAAVVPGGSARPVVAADRAGSTDRAAAVPGGSARLAAAADRVVPADHSVAAVRADRLAAAGRVAIAGSAGSDCRRWDWRGGIRAAGTRSAGRNSG